MNKTILLLSVVAVTALSGCATPIPAEKIKNADYGQPPPENYQALVKASITHSLIDPTAPIYEIGTPSKGYFKRSDMAGTWEMFGWRVCGSVNSKNRFGGYVGSVPFVVLFKDGQVAQQVIGESADMRDGFSLINPAIREACQR